MVNKRLPRAVWEIATGSNRSGLWVLMRCRRGSTASSRHDAAEGDRHSVVGVEPVSLISEMETATTVRPIKAMLG